MFKYLDCLMKKIVLTLAVCLMVFMSEANPLPAPAIQLNKMFFDSHGDWVIELYFAHFKHQYDRYDSLYISSSAGQCRSKKILITNDSGFIILREDSFSHAFTINPDGDSILIRAKFTGSSHNYDVVGLLIFGNYRNATLPKLRHGQSIVSILEYGGFYCISKYQQLGIPYDTSGTSATLHGQLYDKHNQLLSHYTGPTLYFHVNWDGSGLDINSAGVYSKQVYAYNLRIDSLLYFTPDHQIHYAKISPVHVQMEPDSVVLADIHLLDSLFMGTKEAPVLPATLIKVYPDPLQGSSVFHYQISVPVKATRCMIELTNLKGQPVQSYSIREDTGDLSLPENLANGMYLLKLWMNDKVYGTVRLMVVR